MKKLLLILLLIGSSILTTSVFPTGGSGLPNVADSITYIIPANGQTAIPNLVQKHEGITRMSYYIQFDDGCKYSLPTKDSNDINKGYGFSYALLGQHHTNSSRVGWNWKSDTLLLYNYSYFTNTRLQKKINSYARNKPIYVEQWYAGKDTAWIACVQNGKGTAKFVTGVGPINRSSGYLLYPYFGGTSRAPHEMRVTVWGVRFYYN